MKEPPIYGVSRDRGPSVSYGEIERAARALMASGERPTVDAVRKALGRGSPNHLTESMQRFWRDQAALNAGDPVALTRLPRNSPTPRSRSGNRRFGSPSKLQPKKTAPRALTFKSFAAIRMFGCTHWNCARRNGI